MQTSCFGKVVIVVALVLASSPKAHATEQGNMSYPLGAATLLGGAYPPPGETWFMNYTQAYTSNSFVNADGKSSVPKFDATVWVDAIRLVHNWNVNLGVFEWTSAITVPIVSTKIGTAYGVDRNSGIANVGLEAVNVSWTSADRSVFGYFAVPVYVPTGSSVSNDYFSVAPLFAVTWFPTRKLELSGSIGTEFHTTNRTTEYHSGPVAFAEFGANYYAFPSIPELAIGVGGYAVKQFGDDTGGGAFVEDGFRQQVFAFGPQISYGNEKWGVAAKWHHEFSAENRPEGDRFWVQLMIPFPSKP